VGFPAVAAAALLTALPALTPPAIDFPEGSGAVCTFDAANASLAIEIERDPTYIGGTKDGSVTLYQDSDGEIELDGGDGGHEVTCAGGTPTAINVDSIRITKAANVVNASVTLVEGSGTPLAPGATAEPDGSSEIEISIDAGSRTGVAILLIGAGPDRVDFGGLGGAAGANLNAEEAVSDVDLTMADGGIFVIRSGRGDDVLRAGGVLPGFDSAYPGFRGQGAALLGEGGDDVLLGSELRESLVGFAGRDRMVAGGGVDYIEAFDEERDQIDCGAGRDRASFDSRDRRRSCERRITD
jgi:hypothetical protein